MRFMSGCYGVAALCLSVLPIGPAAAAPFFFSTGDPDGKMATASRPTGASTFGIEAADDFALAGSTTITGASFTGLVTGTSATVGQVQIEIFRVFPKDSDTVRTPQVPTRVNSPSDVAFAARDAAGGGLSFSTSTLAGTFTALNSVQAGGIHPLPSVTTGGNGAVSGAEVRFDINFLTPLVLPGDHYFFVPQVEVSGGDFLWLSAPKPIVAPGTPFPPGTTDLQSWTRDDALDPDWLRVGTDIVGGEPPPTFNASFSLTGTSDATPVPEPATLALFLGAVAGLAVRRRPAA